MTDEKDFRKQVKEAKDRLECARSFYDNADSDLVDVAEDVLDSAMVNLNALLKLAKQMGIHSSSIEIKREVRRV